MIYDIKTCIQNNVQDIHPGVEYFSSEVGPFVFSPILCAQTAVQVIFGPKGVEHVKAKRAADGSQDFIHKQVMSLNSFLSDILQLFNKAFVGLCQVKVDLKPGSLTVSRSLIFIPFQDHF